MTPGAGAIFRSVRRRCYGKDTPEETPRDRDGR
jgi:hypothetical protein